MYDSKPSGFILIMNIKILWVVRLFGFVVLIILGLKYEKRDTMTYGSFN